MTFKTYEINVDLVHDTSTTCSNRFSQNDRNSAKLLVTITNKGAELDLSQAKSVRMSFKKPDGTRVFQNDCQPINAMKGKYQIVLKTQTLTSVGNVIAQIHIEEEDRIIDTQKFFFVVNDSLASDEAIESTNEFTIIQKAIEAGKKLEGVDINGIIAAGVKADESLPKAGGTMTGNVDMDISVGAKSKGYRWRDKDGALFGLETSTTGELILYDYKAAARVWQYDPVAKRFNVNSDGNLLKNTGGVMTGDLQINTPNKGFKVGNGVEGITQMVDTNGRYYWYSTLAKTPFYYDIKNDNFVISAPNTNLLKKTGDTMTGDFRIGQGKIHRFQNSDDKSVAALSVDNNGRWYNWSDVSAKRVFMYDPATDTFTIDSANTNLLKKTGDTMAGNFILTSGAMIRQEMPNAPSARGILYIDETSKAAVGGIGYARGNSGVVGEAYMGWGSAPWDAPTALIVSDTKFTYKNKPVAMRDKDGRAELTLTADGENFNGNIGPIADRNGNTVTFRAGLRRKAGATGTLMTTLPLDMRPSISIINVIPSTDGTLARVTVQPNGEVHLENAGGASISGKDVYMAITYVVK
ncbi:phage baseplate upper protein [Bacillus paranthracis]|uniref:BppU family phage baseplate upper protein n=2 Tax=Bacillus paranthracis TaxID=2026186 RepID=UPI001E3ADCA1|nr:BppU family phage baseplate upper protein [Bacillus paranthracis]MCC2412595.1 phage baseplate upper protein [Bacillus paranthracis]